MSRLGFSLPAGLESALGAEGLVPEERLGDYSIDGVIPRIAVRPAERDQILELVRYAADEGLAVLPWGGGTQVGVGNIPQRYDLALDLSRFDRVVDYQPADLTATVEAGISLDAFQRTLAAGGKTLPVEAALSSMATIGGILAANASGPMRATFGLPRDWLIGISVAGGRGVETKSGGKVVKNVTGYDLGKLYSGSMGTLGIIIEATFKLNPLPQRTGALTAAFTSLGAALEAAEELSRKVFAPHGIQVLDRVAASRLRGGPGRETLLAAFFSGRPGAVRRQLAESEDLLRGQSSGVNAMSDQTESGVLLKNVTDLGWETGSAAYMVLKASVPPSSIAGVSGSLQAALAGEDWTLSGGTAPGVVADPTFGMVRVMWWDDGEGTPAEEDAAGLAQIVDRAREVAHSFHGSLVVERAPLEMKRRVDIWGAQPESSEIMRRIKEQLDPSGMFSPGRYVGGI